MQVGVVEVAGNNKVVATRKPIPQPVPVSPRHPQLLPTKKRDSIEHNHDWSDGSCSTSLHCIAVYPSILKNKAAGLLVKIIVRGPVHPVSSIVTMNQVLVSREGQTQAHFCSCDQVSIGKWKDLPFLSLFVLILNPGISSYPIFLDHQPCHALDV